MVSSVARHITGVELGESSQIVPPSGAMENSSMSSDPTGAACQVCGQPAGGRHFGITACRACAAFFRRSVAERKTYECRSAHSCPITTDQRNMCRCCRLKRCEELGMDRREVQLNRDLIGQRGSKRSRPQPFPPPESSQSSDTVEEKPQVSTRHAIADANTSSSPQPSACFGQQAALPPPNISMLQRMLEGYANFRSSQKSLHAVMYPESVFLTPTVANEAAPSCAGSYRLVKHSEYVKMERGCLSLQFSLLNHWHQPFDQLKHDTKLQVLRSFSGRFTHLDQCFHTAKAFPTGDTTRFVMHYGELLDADHLEGFFSEDKDPAESARRSQVTLNRCRRVVCKMRKLAIREVEVAALTGVILWNEVALMNVENAHVLQSQIFRELHDDIFHNYGMNRTGARFGSLLALIRDLNVIEKEIRESVIISRIFNPHLLGVWEDT